jgi:hypothetical protein
MCPSFIPHELWGAHSWPQWDFAKVEILHCITCDTLALSIARVCSKKHAWYLGIS